MFKRAGEQAEAIAASFERARTPRFSSGFAITVDGKSVAAESFPRKP
jgi:hypothetical protein